MLWRLLTDWLVPDRALHVSDPEGVIVRSGTDVLLIDPRPRRDVVRPEIVEATEGAVARERDERTWWPGLGVVAHRGERLEEFLARIEAECDNE